MVNQKLMMNQKLPMLSTLPSSCGLSVVISCISLYSCRLFTSLLSFNQTFVPALDSYLYCSFGHTSFYYHACPLTHSLPLQIKIRIIPSESAVQPTCSALCHHALRCVVFCYSSYLLAFCLFIFSSVLFLRWIVSCTAPLGILYCLTIFCLPFKVNESIMASQSK